MKNNKKNKILLVLTISFVTAIVLSGCGNKNQVDTNGYQGEKK